MEILGTGIDIIEVKRIKNSIKNQNFIKRIFSPKEILFSKSYKNKASFFAKRFAAKEAFAKSIGTGFRKNLNLKDIAISNDKNGKPYILISNKLKKIIINHFKIKRFIFSLSISDEKNYSVAIVIFQKK
tara:strand:- start:4101 stop:4487 length:387 start_codon:yes stop_codon:yes gene_type:complete